MHKARVMRLVYNNIFYYQYIYIYITFLKFLKLTNIVHFNKHFKLGVTMLDMNCKHNTNTTRIFTINVCRK